MSYAYHYPPPQQQSPLVMFLLFGIVGWLLFSNGCFDRVLADQRQQVIDQGQDQQERPSLKNGWLVLIEETKGRPVDRQIVLDSLWAVVPPELGWRRHDPDSDAARTFIARAAAEGVQAPFAMIVDANGKMISVKPFPKEAAGLAAMFQ